MSKNKEERINPQVITRESSTDSVSDLLKDLIRRLAWSDDRAYSSLEQYQSDVRSPLYEASEDFRRLVDARLEASPHLYQNSPHTETNLTSGDAVAARFSVGQGGEVTLVAIGDPGEVGSGDVTPGVPEGHAQHEPELVNTGSSLIMNFSTEREGFGEEE